METKMSLRELAVVVLMWFGVAVNAMPARGLCPDAILENGYSLPDATNHNLFYACEREYKPDQGDWWAMSTCTFGEWTPQPKCIGINRCIAPVIANGAIVHPAKPHYAPGESLVIRCAAGFRLSGVGNTVCRDGSWQSQPKCEKAGCGPIPEIPNGEGTAQTRSGTFATFSCHDGFRLVGTPRVSCSADGTWSNPPFCQALFTQPLTTQTTVATSRSEAPVERCGQAPWVPNAAVEVFAWSILYKCHRGYRLANHMLSRAYCFSDGLWSRPLPQCTECRWCY